MLELVQGTDPGKGKNIYIQGTELGTKVTYIVLEQNCYFKTMGTQTN